MARYWHMQRTSPKVMDFQCEHFNFSVLKSTFPNPQRIHNLFRVVDMSHVFKISTWWPWRNTSRFWTEFPRLSERGDSTERVPWKQWMFLIGINRKLVKIAPPKSKGLGSFWFNSKNHISAYLWPATTFMVFTSAVTLAYLSLMFQHHYEL